MSHEALLESVYASRGRILQLAIQMETYIDIYVSECLSKDETTRSEIVMVLLSKINLKAKKDILEYFLNKDDTNKKEDIKTLIKNIDEVIMQRNLFAHWPIDFSQDALARYSIERVITYVKLKPVRHEGKVHLGEMRLYQEQGVNYVIGLINEINKVLKQIIN